MLLRGINLGSHNKVPMPGLRKALDAAGFEGIATLFQSGNVVVVDRRSSSEVAAEVRRVVHEEFGVDVPCVALDRAGLNDVVTGCPMPKEAASNGKYFNVVYLAQPVKRAHLSTFDPQQVDPGRIRVARQAIYQWCPDGFHRAPQLLPQIEKRWKVTGTVRNWNTTLKLLEMMHDAEAG